LILEAIGDLLGAVRPGFLAQSDIMPLYLATLEEGGPLLRHPDDEEKSQPGLNEKPYYFDHGIPRGGQAL
jgi:hypothetical protein